jgi:hypothetical protein
MAGMFGLEQAMLAANDWLESLEDTTNLPAPPVNGDT